MDGYMIEFFSRVYITSYYLELQSALLVAAIIYMVLYTIET
jgi:hypothetical protein